VFYLDPLHIYRVSELDELKWLDHGFGTRLADIPALYPNLATLKQIHSAACVEAHGRSGTLGQGDALLEDAPGATVAVRTADCLPILLADEQRHAVAVVHAGWRGTVAEITRHAVAAMQEQFGSDPPSLHAAIGPGIGKCCYEVGPEVAAHFGEQGKAHIDLAAANQRQLRKSGVTAGRIYASNLCTRCGAAEFHSYRRDKEAAGRMYAFAGIRSAVE
jgi:YfiH family protein